MPTEGIRLGSLSTPALLLDEAKMMRNIERLEAQAQTLGVTLRPHLKTAKSVEVARRLNKGVAAAITVSTLAEAEAFHAAGFTDILYAVGIAPQKLARRASLARCWPALPGCQRRLDPNRPRRPRFIWRDRVARRGLYVL